MNISDAMLAFANSQTPLEKLKSECKVDSFCVKKQPIGIRITHIPTGIVTESSSQKSQYKNKEIALAELNEILFLRRKIEWRKEEVERLNAEVNSLVGETYIFERKLKMLNAQEIEW